VNDDGRRPDGLTVEHEGLGYRGFYVGEGLGLHVDRMTESRGDVSGELTVAVAGQGHLMRARFNLSSMTARASTAKYLQSRVRMGGEGRPDWATILESFCVQVLDLEREGTEVELIGQAPPREAPSFLLEPFILGGNVATILYGDGGTGKSTLAACAAVAIATGTTTFAGWRVAKRTDVLVLDWEVDGSDWNDLIALVSEGIGIAPPAIAYKGCDRSLPSMLHEVAKEVTNREIGLLIVDSVGHAMPSSHEGASAEEGAIRLFKALRQLGVPALLIDHKPKNEERNGPYGSVYKMNSARAAWELRAGEEPDEDGDSHLALIHRKHNLTPRMKPVGIRLSRSAGHILLRHEAIAEDEKLVGAMTISQRVERVLLRSTPMTLTAIADALGTGPKTIAVTLNRYSDRFVKAGKDGKADLWAAKSNMLDLQLQHVGDGVLEGPPTNGGVLRTPPPDVVGTPQTPLRDDRGSFDALIKANEERYSSTGHVASEA